MKCRQPLSGGSSLPFSPLLRLSREFSHAIQKNGDYKKDVYIVFSLALHLQCFMQVWIYGTGVLEEVSGDSLWEKIIFSKATKLVCTLMSKNLRY